MGKATRWIPAAIFCAFTICGLFTFAATAHAEPGNLGAGNSVLSTQGVGKCVWDEYQWLDGLTTSKKICLTGYYFGSDKRPSGYVVYRKAPGKKTYKKLATVKKKSRTMNYTDRKVSFSKRYSYKFRAYRTVNGKKVYGPYSKAVKMRAVDRTGSCALQFLTQRGAMVPSLDMKLASGKTNGKIIIAGTIDYFQDAKTGYAEDDVDATLRLSAVSSDGTNWSAAPKKVTISAGQTKYLRFMVEDSDTHGDIDSFLFDPKESNTSLKFNDMTYNGFEAYMDMSFESGRAFACIDGELYH